MAVGGLAPAYAAAQPLSSVQCQDSFGSVTIDADVVVPANQTCELNGTTVTGDITVKRNGTLSTWGAALGDSGSTLGLKRNAYAFLSMSNVGGEVNLRNAVGMYAERTSFDGKLRARRGGFVYLYDSTTDCGVRAGRDVGFAAEATDISGKVRGKNVTYVDLYDSTVTGKVRITDSGQGSFLCSTHVESALRLADNDGTLQVGGASEIVGEGCGGNVVDDGVRLTDNRGEIIVRGNFIQGNLVCRYNETDPVGTDNVVFGDIRGECTDMQAPSPPGRPDEVRVRPDSPGPAAGTGTGSR